MRQEYFKQTQLVAKLESKIDKLQSNSASTQLINELRLEVQKLNLKLKKESDKKISAEKAKTKAQSDYDLTKKMNNQYES